MSIEAYRRVLGNRDARRVLALSFLIRVPLWAANVLLTLHVVTHLHESYAAAGVLTGAVTVALAISAPWRGRRLDRVGLRRSVAPSLAVMAGCWSVAPFVGYWPLMLLAALAGLFMVPGFSIVRQALIHAVDETQRKSALAIDSVMVEMSFMLGPALGVLLATYAPTSWALFGCQWCVIAGAAVLWLADPQLRKPSEASAPQRRVDVRSWLSPALMAVLAMSAAATVVLTGTDVGVVAALRHLGHQSWIGWELTVWGLGSAIGGFVYGAVHRSVPVAVLLGLLAASTLPVALARDPLAIAALLLVAGLFCAPTVTASVDAISRLVPEHVRGEALGWHGSAMTAGSAIGAPLAGVAIDRFGWRGGFVLPALAGLAVAVVGVRVLRRRIAPARAPDAVAVEAAY